eukprot:scaffold34897_cov59-Phaeocystis_antarctica.AAC.3
MRVRVRVSGESGSGYGLGLHERVAPSAAHQAESQSWRATRSAGPSPAAAPPPSGPPSGTRRLPRSWGSTAPSPERRRGRSRWLRVADPSPKDPPPPGWRSARA